ncbi:hypothetical protein [Bosea sp. 117]|uniref:hypothetical protein n=1 Tax=Bosea sp. 117 TaxID=1125973 RepID=UPI000493E1D1|nr:hypothetical protein [Bosea sp. 117]
MAFTSPPPVHAFWIGAELGLISRTCLTSFVRVGHPVTLHGYQRPADLPTGIVFSDAARIVPPHRVTRHRATGSYALFANIFRYRLLEQCDGIYVDCDVFCLKPLEIDDYLFGYEDETTLNTAILRLPKDSALLRSLNEVSDDPAPIPPWMPPELRAELRQKAEVGQPTLLEDLPWGVIGPRALTWLAREHGVDRHALPVDVLYPVHYGAVDRLLDPELTVESLITPRTRCVHLFNEMLRRLDLSRIPKTSPLGRMITMTR